MKKIAFILSFSLLCQLGYSQKPLSKATVKDFAAVCWFNYRYGTQMFKSCMYHYLPYSRSEVAVLMENLDTNPKGRNEVLKVFYTISSGNYESIFNYLYKLNLTAEEAKELATYAVYKFN